MYVQIFIDGHLNHQYLSLLVFTHAFKSFVYSEISLFIPIKHYRLKFRYHKTLMKLEFVYEKFTVSVENIFLVINILFQKQKVFL